MKISVVLPTNRPSGTKFALHGLAKQSFPQKDFELIIVDDYPEDREKLIRSRSELLGLWNLKVLRSKPNYWRSNRLIGNARNTALIHADGELVVFLDDYCWIRSRWLDEHWNTYKRTPFTMVGAMKAVKYEGGVYDDLDQFPPPSEGEDWGERERLRAWDSPEQRERAREVGYSPTDSRGDKNKRDCGGGWFFSCNASIPMVKLVEVNGFDEQYDLTSEEDIDLGLRLERGGCKFWYRPDADCTVFHMDHRDIDREMKGWSKRYKEVSYEELRGRGVVESNPDEVQLVLKEKYGTRYDGSWGLHEYNKQKTVANIVDGNKIFDLKMERWKLRHASTCNSVRLR